MGSTKRVLLTIVICTGILFAWTYAQYFMKKDKKPVAAKKEADKGKGKKKHAPSAATQPTPASAPASAPAPTSQPMAPKESRVPVEAGVKSTVKTKEAVGVFTSTGAVLRSWKLTDPRYQEVVKGKLRPIDLVQSLEKKGFWPLETTFSPQDSDFQLPAHASFSTIRSSDTEVLYRWESSKVRVTKHYTIDQKRPVIWLSLKVRNLTNKPLRHRLQLSLYNTQDPGQGKASFTNPFPKISMVMCHVNGEIHRRSLAAIQGEGSGCSAAGCGMGDGEVSATGYVRWIGSGDRYFMIAVVPQNRDESRRCELKIKEENVIHASMLFTAAKIKPNETLSRKFIVFVGPKDLDRLDAVTGPDEEESKLSDSIAFGWFAVLCRPMLWLLKLFYSWVGNWGIAIIFLTLVVKLLTLYWTQKSMRSMKEMQRLKPKIDLLREKFKDDKQRLNQEMMALYKVHKVNPLGGCLPMVIQMPVWFALYRTLGNSVVLYRSNFVGWITDLTAPDPYYILPIAMGISMYAQQAISPQPIEGTQAKVMKYFMPGMLTVMMLALPSGLTLYIFVNTVLTMIHQWYMNKTDKQREPKTPKDPEKKAEKPSPPPRRETEDKEADAGRQKEKLKRRRRRRRK